MDTEGSMEEKEKRGSLFDRLKVHSWFLGLLWTACILASLLWNLYEQREKILKIALNSAHLTFEKDIIYRKWAARHGGVYVPVSEHTPPNPYLMVPNRDITLPSGLSLTLVNPAYMTRQVNQMAAELHDGRSHITSLNPIRPGNRPDPWEAAGLRSFEKGVKEVSSVEKIGDQDYMRLMHPFITEKDCLKCHAAQGYQEGDIRGGISISIPMGPLWAIERPLITRVTLAHLLLWLIGLVGIQISRKGFARHILARELVEGALHESADRLRIVADFTYDWEYWRGPDGRFLYVSPSCERITGYSREEFMQDPEILSRILHPEDRERVLAHLREDQSRQELCELEFRIVHRDGRERWIGHACKLVLDSNGQSLGRRVSDRDITERKHTDQALEQRTLELQHLTDTLEIRIQERTTELARANEALRQLSVRLLSTQEEERKRVAAEIHDALAGSLAGIKFKVEGSLLEVEKDPNTATESLNSLIPLIRDSIEECRRIQQDLRPSMLDDLGLLITLSWFCKRFQAIHRGIRIEQEMTIEEIEIPEGLKNVIYRIAQEAMNNIAKHSQADLVRLCLLKTEGRMTLVLEDNGQGFDLNKKAGLEGTSRGFGLLSMKERTELSGGFFEIESTEGKGTVIRANWDL